MRVVYRSAQVIMIAVLATIIYNNIYAFATARSAAQSVPVYPAVYVGPDNDKTLVTDQIREQYKIAKVHTSKELDEYVKQSPKTAVIYIHPSNFDAINPNWLQAQYKRGVAIVALNVPINPLAKMLGQEIPPAVVDGVEKPQADLPIRQDRILISVFHSVFDPSSQKVTGWGWYSNYHQETDTLPPLVNGLLQGNNKK